MKYFRPVKKSCEQLPDPHGPLNTDGKVLSSAIASANIAAQTVLTEASDKSDTANSSSGSRRGHYLHLTPAQKFNIGKRASEHGVTSALRYYKKTFLDLPLKETFVQRFKKLFE